jgi:hypothetical protein
MSRRAKILIGIAAFSPCFAFLHILLAVTVNLVAKAFLSEQAVKSLTPFLWFPLFVTWGIMSIASMVSYVICAYHCDAQQLKGWKKLKWILFIGFVPSVAVPIYWYRCVWLSQRLGV